MLRSTYEQAINLACSAPLKPTLLIKPGKAGFFGEVFVTLNGLRFCEQRAVDAHVRWGKTSPYFDAAHGDNAWRYYFKDAIYPFSGSTGATRARLQLSYQPGVQDFERYPGKSVKASVARALRAWCTPHDEIVADVERIVQDGFKDRPALGVHVRLTDAAAGAEGRKTLDLKAYLEAVDEQRAAMPDSMIYLASDDQRVVQAFEERYPGLVASQDCTRSEDGTSIHGHYDQGIDVSPYLKGREVLIDALVLARCAFLIRTHSRVTCFTLCWNTALPYRDLERERLGVDRTPWLHE